eukprot:TRINITY_DN5977_c0_g1_i1.p1 TRINITY_DN5977_c0_g1~~TRINITY_DN5977_c0_g1_i1.p1  ORF type:complete len:684 (-),score=70.19 TRINITY_DN5977_c0_g1_i1:295-2346(-)
MSSFKDDALDLMKIGTVGKSIFAIVCAIFAAMFAAAIASVCMQCFFIVFEADFEKSWLHYCTLLVAPAFLLAGSIATCVLLELYADALDKPSFPKFRSYLGVVCGETKNMHIIDHMMMPLLLISAAIPCIYRLCTGGGLLSDAFALATALSGVFYLVIIAQFVYFCCKFYVEIVNPDLVPKRTKLQEILEKHKEGNYQSDAAPYSPIEESDAAPYSPRDVAGDLGTTWKAVGGIIAVTIVIIVEIGLLSSGTIGIKVAAPIYVVCIIGLIYSAKQLLPYKVVSGVPTLMICFLALMTGLTLFSMSGQWRPGDKEKYIPFADPPAEGFKYQHLFEDDAYPVCNMRWGSSDDEAKTLGVLDLGLFSSSIYYDGSKTKMEERIRNHTRGTAIAGDISVEDLAPVHQSGRWGLFKIPAAKTCVFAIRGTHNFADAMVDADMWSGVSVLQTFGAFLPILQLLPTSYIQEEIKTMNIHNFYEHKTVRETLVAAGKEAQQTCEKLHYDLVVTGHSLGGGLAQIVGSVIGAPTVAWSPVGVLYSMKRFNITQGEVYRNIVNIMPDHDPVPKIDAQRGFDQHIRCSSGGISALCHNILNSVCELERVCGDPRGRDMSKQCLHTNKNWKKYDVDERSREKKSLRKSASKRGKGLRKSASKRGSKTKTPEEKPQSESKTSSMAKVPEGKTKADA